MSRPGRIRRYNPDRGGQVSAAVDRCIKAFDKETPSPSVATRIVRNSDQR